MQGIMPASPHRGGSSGQQEFRELKHLQLQRKLPTTLHRQACHVRRVIEDRKSRSPGSSLCDDWPGRAGRAPQRSSAKAEALRCNCPGDRRSREMREQRPANERFGNLKERQADIEWSMEDLACLQLQGTDLPNFAACCQGLQGPLPPHSSSACANCRHTLAAHGKLPANRRFGQGGMSEPEHRSVIVQGTGCKGHGYNRTQQILSQLKMKGTESR